MSKLFSRISMRLKKEREKMLLNEQSIPKPNLISKIRLLQFIHLIKSDVNLCSLYSKLNYNYTYEGDIDVVISTEKFYLLLTIARQINEKSGYYLTCNSKKNKGADYLKMKTIFKSFKTYFSNRQDLI